MRFAARERLIEKGMKTGDPATARRFHAIAKLASGLGISETARQLDLAVSTVSNAADRFLAEGVDGLLDHRVGNGRRKVDDAFLGKVAELLAGSPQDHGWTRPTWTRELFCKEMERQGFALVAVCTMGRALRELGARLGSPRPVVLCPWPREKRLRLLRKLRHIEAAASRSEPVYFADEVDLHLNPKIGRDWMARGFQRRVLTPGKNAKHYLAGALDARTRKLVYVEGTTKASDLFCRLLWKLAAMHRRAGPVHLILDNYIIHTSKRTKKVLESLEGKIVLHFLPPYCPDANRIERVWQDLHANVTRNHRCRSMQELLEHVRSFLAAYNNRGLVNPSLRRADEADRRAE